jgi:hypothetical protein
MRIKSPKGKRAEHDNRDQCTGMHATLVLGCALHEKGTSTIIRGTPMLKVEGLELRHVYAA